MRMIISRKGSHRTRRSSATGALQATTMLLMERSFIKAAPLGNGLVKAETGSDTTDAIYQNWYKEVYQPVLSGNTNYNYPDPEEEEEP